MTKVKDIINIIEDFAPLDFQEEYDNCGLTIGDREREVQSVLIALDITFEVVREAIDKGCQMIISHHPVIFNPIKSITTDTFQGETLLELIKNDISVYSAHTNVDNADENIAREFMYTLGVENICPIIDSCGMTASMIKPLTFLELIEKVKVASGDNNIRSIGILDDIVEEICFANGANGSNEDLLVRAGSIADVFITSELKYHLAVKAKEIGLNIIEIGHYESEREFVNLMNRKLKDSNIDVSITNSEISVSPYNI